MTYRAYNETKDKKAKGKTGAAVPLPESQPLVTGSIVEESLDITECAAFLKVSESYALELVGAGEIPGAKIGRAWVFLKSDLVEYLRRQIRLTTAEIKARAEIDERARRAKERHPPALPVVREAIMRPNPRRRVPPTLPDVASPEALRELAAA